MKNFPFGNGICLYPIKKFRENRHDMLTNITGNNKKKQIFTRLKLAASGFNYNLKDAGSCQLLLTNGLNFDEVRAHFQRLHLAFIFS